VAQGHGHRVGDGPRRGRVAGLAATRPMRIDSLTLWQLNLSEVLEQLSHPVQSLASSSPPELPASPREIARNSSRETLAFAVQHMCAGDNEPCVQVSIRRSAQ